MECWSYLHTMRILFSTRPAFGHVYPLMPLAMAARDAGHDVTFATTGRFLDKLPSAGFPTHDVGLTIEQARDQVVGGLPGAPMPKGEDGRPDLEFGARMFFDVLARNTARDLAPLLDSIKPDIVVYEQMDFGAAIVANAAGIPAVLHSLSPRMPEEILQMLAYDRLERLWSEFGRGDASLNVFTGDLYLDIFPTCLQQSSFLQDPARVRMRAIPFAEQDARIPAWVGSTDRPLVYLTLGTVVAEDKALSPAIDGLATLDADILLALGSAAGSELGLLPKNVRVEPFVNQAELWPAVDLFVHHGGSGTLLGALSHGTPQLLLPKGADQFFNADVMAANEMADVLEPRQVTPEAVATLAASAMKTHRRAADAVRDEIAAMPHPREVLESLVDQIC
jgi:UDP:flavonoid glycosyltransferase YjiC (YdhE family)